MESREEKSNAKRGLWKPEEDLILRSYVEAYGEGNWADISRKSGLKRGGKSCRLRWKNYLRPNIKRGGMSKQEEDLIIRMHKLLGNRWSLIAGRLPGRTDNEVKNYWNTHLNKKCESRKRKAVESDGRPPNNDASTQQQRISENAVKSLEVLSQDAEEAKKEKREESIVTTTWMEDANGFGYGIGSPLVFPEYTTSVFDDFQPLYGFTDLFPLF